MPQDAKLSYKGYPLLISQVSSAERTSEVAVTKTAVTHPISVPPAQYACSPIASSEESNLPLIYLVDRRLPCCPLCQGTLTNTEKALRIKYSSKNKEKLFLQIQGKKCSKCHAMFVLAPVYERLSQGRSFFVELKDLPVSEPSLDITGTTPLPRRDNGNTHPAHAEAVSITEDWIALPQKEAALEVVRIRDVFTNPEYSNLVLALEHDGYIFLSDLVAIKQLPGYVQRNGKMTWQGTLHAVHDIQRVQSLVAKTALAKMIPKEKSSKEEQSLEMKSIEYKIVYEKQEFSTDTLSSLLIWICEHMIERNPQKMLQLVQEPLFGKSSNVFLTVAPAKNIPCHKLSNGTWIHIGFSDHILLNMICAILSYCGNAAREFRLWKTTNTSGNYELVPISLDYQSQVYCDDAIESEKLACRNGFTYKPEEAQIDLQKSTFEKWICEIKQLAPRTARAYSGAIFTCAEYAKKAKLQYSSFYTVKDVSIFIQMQKRLAVYGPFVKLNRDGHNMYSAALSCYREFLQARYTPDANAKPAARNPQQMHVVPFVKPEELLGAVQFVQQPAPQRLSSPASRYTSKAASLPRPRQASTNTFGATECVLAIEKFLRGQGLEAVFLSEIIEGAQLFQYTRAAIQNEISRNSNIVEIVNGCYVHRDSILDIDSAADALLSVLMQQFLQFDGYSNSHILYAATRIELAMFLNDNDLDNEKSVYFLARHLFEKEGYGNAHFTFLDNLHIFQIKPDFPPNIRGLLLHKARLDGGYITRAVCERILKQLELSYNNGINGILLQNNDDSFLQYNDGEFLLAEALLIDDAWFKRISIALSMLFEEAAYVIPRDIAKDWYLQLPALPLGLRWTTLLLQELIQRYKQIPYIAIFAPLDRQACDKIAAAFVPMSDELPTFADIVYDYVSIRLPLPQRMPAEELRLLLRNAGMLDGNELIYNMHKALPDQRFAWSDENRTVYIRKR